MRTRNADSIARKLAQLLRRTILPTFLCLSELFLCLSELLKYLRFCPWHRLRWRRRPDAVLKSRGHAVAAFKKCHTGTLKISCRKGPLPHRPNSPGGAILNTADSPVPLDCSATRDRRSLPCVAVPVFVGCPEGGSPDAKSTNSNADGFVLWPLQHARRASGLQRMAGPSARRSRRSRRQMRSTIGVAIAVAAIVAIVAIAGDWTSVGFRHGPPVSNCRPLFFGAAILRTGGRSLFANLVPKERAGNARTRPYNRASLGETRWRRLHIQIREGLAS
jgi:hypothetical protein